MKAVTAFHLTAVFQCSIACMSATRSLPAVARSRPSEGSGDIRRRRQRRHRRQSTPCRSSRAFFDFRRFWNLGLEQESTSNRKIMGRHNALSSSLVRQPEGQGTRVACDCCQEWLRWEPGRSTLQGHVIASAYCWNRLVVVVVMVMCSLNRLAMCSLNRLAICSQRYFSY